MAVGDSAEVGLKSYVAIGKETTYGTYASATTSIEALSCSFRTDIDSIKLESFGTGTRNFTKRVQTDKKVGGSLEQYLHPIESVFFMANALGGALVTTSLTSAATHSLSSGNYDTSTAILGLSVNERKGSNSNHVFRYSGGRVNNLVISAEVGQPVKMSAEIIFKDSTLVSDDISASLSISSVTPFIYHQGVYRYQATEAAAQTTTAEERIQSFEMTISNNLEEGRELGSNVLRVLPGKRQDIQLTVTQRWDTTTTYNRFIQATQGSIEFVFTGQSISAEHNNKLTIRLPKVFQNSSDPEIGGPDELLMSEIAFDVVNDNPNTSTGKAVGMTIINSVIAY